MSPLNPLHTPFPWTSKTAQIPTLIMVERKFSIYLIQKAPVRSSFILKKCVQPHKGHTTRTQRERQARKKHLTHCFEATLLWLEMKFPLKENLGALITCLKVFEDTISMWVNQTYNHWWLKYPTRVSTTLGLLREWFSVQKHFIKVPRTGLILPEKPGD